METSPQPPPQPETHSAEMMPTATGTSKLPEPKDPMKVADADMKAVLTELAALNGKPIETLSAEEARKQPTPTDAVKKVLEKNNKPTSPLEMAKVENRKIPGAAGPIAARIYTPKTDEKGPLPVINAGTFGGDPKRIAVAGESAGGNLAANVSIMARDKSAPMPVHQLLVYPVAQTGMSTESYREWDMAKPLNKAMMVWFVEKFTRTPEDAKDPRLDLVAANLKNLPKTTIVNAEIDPLRSDGQMLADKLKAAGVSVERKTYEGVTHEFFGMGAVVSDAKDAESYAGGRLKDAFKK